MTAVRLALLPFLAIAAATPVAGMPSSHSEPLPLPAAATSLPPSVELLVAPSPGDTVYFAVPFSWKGSDPDGFVSSYRVAIDPGPGGPLWISTFRTQQSFFFSSRTLVLPIPSSGPIRFADPHTFEVEAVDNDGLFSPPASRSFVSYTIAPEVQITNPTPSPATYVQIDSSHVRIAWQGTDWDGVFTNQPVRYKYKLLRQGSAEFNWSIVLSDPDSLRRFYAPAFAGWDSTSGDSAAVVYANLIPGVDYLFSMVGLDEAGAYSARFALGGNLLWMRIAPWAGVSAPAAAAPRLSPPHPNPARTSASVEVAVPRQAPVDVEVFDASGRKVRTLAACAMGGGVHPLAWNLTDARGRRVDAGLYLVRLRTLGVQLTRKLLVVR